MRAVEKLKTAVSRKPQWGYKEMSFDCKLHFFSEEERSDRSGKHFTHGKEMDVGVLKTG